MKIPSNRLTSNSELLTFFNIQLIIEKEQKSLINLTKLLLCISSISSKKPENLKKISKLDLSLVKLYYDSVYLYLIKNTEKKYSTSVNTIFTNSLFDEEKNSDKKEIEKLKKIIEEKDSIIKQYKSSALLNHDISVIQTDQDFLAEDMTMMNFLDFDIKSNSKDYKIEKNSFSFEKLNIKQIFIDSLPTSSKNTNNSNSYSQNLSISKQFFNLSGGNFFHMKIEMNEKLIHDYENQIKNLKEQIETINNKYNEKIKQLTLNHENEIQKTSKKKGDSKKLNKFTTEKNIEIENLKNIIIQNEHNKNKKIMELEDQLKEEKMNREKEIEKFNSDRLKLKDEYDAKINELSCKCKDYENELIIAQNKLKSNPFVAREIMSKTLFNFASEIMNVKK